MRLLYRQIFAFLILGMGMSPLWCQTAFDSTSQSVLRDITSRLQKGASSQQLGEALYALSIKDLMINGNADEAIRNMLEAIGVFDEIQNKDVANRLRLDISLLYLSEQYPKEAERHLVDAQNYYAATGDSIAMAIAMNFLTDTRLALDQVDTAVSIVREVRSIARSTSDSLVSHLNHTTISALNRGGIRVEGIADSSIVTLDRTRSIPQDYYSLALVNSGYYHMMRSQPGIAEYYLKKVIESSKNSGEILRDAYRHMATLKEQNADIGAAYMYLQQYSRLNDSLLNERRQNIISRLQTKQSALEQQAQISQLEKDRNIADIQNRLSRILTFSLLFGSVIVLVGAYFTIRNYQHRLNSNQIILKQNEEINKGRINELENNLKIETMQSMIMGQEAERERIAKDLHDSLGGLLSTIKLHFDSVQTRNVSVQDVPEYQKANQLLDEACKEVRNISNNMQPGALLRMGVVSAISDLLNRIQGDDTPEIDFQHFGLNGQLDQTVALNIFRIVQELLNNALKHAQASHVLIQLIEKDNELMVMVEDDGIGYDSSIVNKGMGTGNIASRVNFLKGDLSIHSVIGEGTSTLINIPLSKD